jgi:hypothetical protein
VRFDLGPRRRFGSWVCNRIDIIGGERECVCVDSALESIRSLGSGRRCAPVRVSSTTASKRTTHTTHCDRASQLISVLKGIVCAPHDLHAWFAHCELQSVRGHAA